MFGLCIFMLCILFWGCSGDILTDFFVLEILEAGYEDVFGESENDESELEAIPLDEKIKGEYFFDYEHPIFFMEECRFKENADEIRCGLVALGVRTDADSCCSEVDFSNVMVTYQNAAKENILSFAAVDRNPPSFFENEKKEPITTFSSMKFRDCSDLIKIKNKLIESDSKGVVEFEITDGSGKIIHIDYQMEMIYLKKFISLEKDGAVFRKNDNFDIEASQCLPTSNIEYDSLFFSYTMLNQCVLHCDTCNSYFPIVKPSTNFCGRFNFDKSFILKKNSDEISEDTLPFSRRFVNVYGYDNAVLYYEWEEK